MSPAGVKQDLSYNDFFSKELKPGQRPVEERYGARSSVPVMPNLRHPITEYGSAKIKHRRIR